MIVFADTSALAKVVWVEAESATMHEILEQADPLIIAGTTYVELRAGLAAALRHRRVAPAARDTCMAVIGTLIRWATTVPLDPSLVLEAGDLAEAANLRALDALQLASLKRIDPRAAHFACWDLELRRAAVAEGYRLLPATENVTSTT